MNRVIRLLFLGVLIPLAVEAQSNKDKTDVCDKTNGRPKFCDEALAISLIEFKGVENQGAVKLSWQAIEDSNHSHYLIQRSSDAVNFKTIGRTTLKHFTDNTVTGSAYYRLVDVDRIQGETPHRIIFVKVDYSPISYKVYRLNGEYLSTFTSYSDIPKNTPLIINGVKTAIK